MENETNGADDIRSLAEMLVNRNLHPDGPYTPLQDLLADKIISDIDRLGVQEEVYKEMRRMIEEQQNT